MDSTTTEENSLHKEEPTQGKTTTQEFSQEVQNEAKERNIPDHIMSKVVIGYGGPKFK